MALKSGPAAKFFKCQKISTLISVYFCRRMLRTRIAGIILQCGMAKENASGECSGWNTKEKRMGSLSNTFVPDSSPVISLYFSLVQGAYMALIQLFNNHYCLICRGYITESTAGVFLELWKAFDTIDQHSLLNKLDHYSLRGHSFN